MWIYHVRSFVYLIGIMFLSSCLSITEETVPLSFMDDFESYQVVSDLFVGNQGWTGTNLSTGDNTIEVDSTFARTGQRSLRFSARGSNPETTLSKCSLFNQAIEYEEGETVEITAWYYLEGTSWENGWVFLLDLEERVPIGAQPGTRLALTKDPGNPLIIEFKYHQSSVVQQTDLQRAFPLNEWVEIRWIVRLSQGQDGAVEVWQNQNLLMQAEGIQTLPKDQIYAIQGTRGIYNSIEVGITANADSEEKVLYVDDFLIRKLN